MVAETIETIDWQKRDAILRQAKETFFDLLDFAPPDTRLLLKEKIKEGKITPDIYGVDYETDCKCIYGWIAWDATTDIEHLPHFYGDNGLENMLELYRGENLVDGWNYDVRPECLEMLFSWMEEWEQKRGSS